MLLLARLEKMTEQDTYWERIVKELIRGQCIVKSQDGPTTHQVIWLCSWLILDIIDG